MAWFMRGVQSAVFHYVSCAPCTGYAEGRKRRKAAKQARKLLEKLEIEEPGAYRHPGPTMTNPFWDEEIAMGPRPPLRRTRKPGAGSSRAVTTACTQNSALSKEGSSMDVQRAGDTRLSHDSQEDDEHWNHKRYQREDEDLWGHADSLLSLPCKASTSLDGASRLSSRRPGTPRSEDYYTARHPPVNDLHPPVVSLLPADPADNLWMLQPPPKTSIMAGKERASNRSRSGSGASSRVELRLPRQLSMRQMQQKLEKGDALDIPSLSRASSYSDIMLAGQRRDRCRLPQAQPHSVNSSRETKRRDTLVPSDAFNTSPSSEESKDVRFWGSRSPQIASPPVIKADRVRQSRQCLSTILSSASGTNNASIMADHEKEKNIDDHESTAPYTENSRPSRRRCYTSAQPSDLKSFMYEQRPPLSSSDISSLNCLQELVSPNALLRSRFVSAPLVEAKIRLPPSDEDLVSFVRQEGARGRFSASRAWGADPPEDESQQRLERDPRFRWTISF